MHIWAQPRTMAGGAWHAVNNPFLTMQNVSLNVVSPQTAFTMGSVVVHNPVYLSGNPRFGGVDDSSTGLVVATGALPGTFDDPPAGFSKGLLDVQGFSVHANSGDGFGGTCDSLDTQYCATTSGGSDAWLFASFTVTPTASTGTLEFSLQVGTNGMNHFQDPSGSVNTTVNFGLDSIGAAPPAYNASTARRYTHPDDDRDAVLSLALVGDYDASGSVDPNDFTVWRQTYGTPTYDADGNGDGIVNAADYTVWRDIYPFPALPAGIQSLPVPEPHALALLLIAGLTRTTRPRQAARPSSGG